MKQNGLISNYTIDQYKVYTSKCNELSTPNIVYRRFDNKDKLEIAVSEATNKILKY